MPFFEKMKGKNSGPQVTEGFYEIDWEAASPCQREAIGRLGKTIQLEQEAYLSQNPKIRCILETFFSTEVNARKSRLNMRDAAATMIEVCDNIDNAPANMCENFSDKPMFTYEDRDIAIDLKNIYNKYHPPPCDHEPSMILPTPNTLSSSFISIVTSATTVPTPEPIPTPEPTLSEVMMQVVSNTVDKAIYSRVNETALKYDTAYVELAKAVEEAMEIPVIEIRADIAELFFCAYRMFELNIIEKERIAAEIAWEKRMRKKLKRTLRRMDNFKGYATPPTPKSEISSHESYKVPPPRPCICHPQFHYNRYPKDRFGIYLPRGEEFSKESVTAPLTLSDDDEEVVIGEAGGSAV